MQETNETQVQSMDQEDPLEESIATHSSIPAWRIHGQRGLVGYSPWGHKESDATEVIERAGQLCVKRLPKKEKKTRWSRKKCSSNS